MWTCIIDLTETIFQLESIMKVAILIENWPEKIVQFVGTEFEHVKSWDLHTIVWTQIKNF